MCYEQIELKEGELVVFLGVHALRWNWQEWGEPKVGFIECDCNQKAEALQADNWSLYGSMQKLYKILKGRGIDDMAEAVSREIEKHTIAGKEVEG